MLVFKGRSQTFPDFPSSLAVLSSANPVNSITVSNVAFCESCKRNDWVMILNNLGERTFHQIQNINGNELEFRQRFGAPVTSGIAVIQGVYLLSDVVRVVDMGAG